MTRMMFMIVSVLVLLPIAEGTMQAACPAPQVRTVAGDDRTDGSRVVATSHSLADADADGVDDAVDLCTNTPPDTAVDAVGRPLGDIDQDCDTDLDDFALFGQGFTGQIAPRGMAPVPGGEFDMGDYHDGMSFALPVHRVRLSPFHMSRYEITNAEYAAALNWAQAQGNQITITNGVVYKADSGTSYPYCYTTSSPFRSRITWNGSSFGVVAGKENHAMVRVSWYGAAAYTNWRSQMEGRAPCFNTSTWSCNFLAGGYRLPTEAEWEYAARGGLHNPYRRYPWGDTLDGSRANYLHSGDPFETGPWPLTTPVGYYAPNGYDLYDMAGNVWEWVYDWYGDYSDGFVENPKGPATGTYRVVRGGSWVNGDQDLRCASRYLSGLDDRDSSVGFRLALGSE